MTGEGWEHYKDRVRLRCARLIRWDYEEREQLPVDRAQEVVSAALNLNLRRIGDRRADEIIDALLRLAIERYLETDEFEPDESVEGNCHAYAGEGRAWLAEEATRNLKDALHARAKVRRQEAAYQAAACIAALREKAPT